MELGLSPRGSAALPPSLSVFSLSSRRGSRLPEGLCTVATVSPWYADRDIDLGSLSATCVRSHNRVGKSERQSQSQSQTEREGETETERDRGSGSGLTGIMKLLCAPSGLGSLGGQRPTTSSSSCRQRGSAAYRCATCRSAPSRTSPISSSSLPIVSSKSCEILNIAPSATHRDGAAPSAWSLSLSLSLSPSLALSAQALLGGDPRSQVLVAQRQQIVDETQARAAEQKAWKCLKNSAGAAARQ